MPVTVTLDKANGVLSLDSCASTISKSFSFPIITGFSTTVQVKVTPDPTATLTSLSVVSEREDGVGTIKEINRSHNMHH